jgi:hypothetical protein
MTETPTEETTGKSRSAYLPVLPDGWRYDVVLLGPDGQKVHIQAARDETLELDPYRQSITVVTGVDNTLKGLEEETLADAVKRAVKTVRNLRDLAAHEKKAAQAREELLSAIGRPSPQREDGTLATPASLNEAKGREKFKPGGQIQTNASDDA